MGIRGLGFRILGLGFRVEDFGCRVQGLGGKGRRVWCLGVLGMGVGGYRISGLRIWFGICGWCFPKGPSTQ